MTTFDIANFFKVKFGWLEDLTVGKINNTLDKALCFYGNRRPYSKLDTVGGRENRSYEILPTTILLRYGNNAVEADKMAQTVYDFFDEKTFEINDKRVFTVPLYQFPISLGTDDKGIYEYSFELDFYYMK